MKRRSTIVFAFALIAGLGCGVPAAATASGPLLSGYGGPGSGSQVILGSTLLGGGGSGGSSQGGGSGSGVNVAAGGTGSAGTTTRVVSPPKTGAAGGTSAGRSSSTSKGGQDEVSSGSPQSRGAATHPGAAGANPKTPTLQVGPATSSVSSSWFSGADILALALAAGALMLVGLATMRIARTEHH